jgi:magnesium chelatase subunit I
VETSDEIPYGEYRQRLERVSGLKQVTEKYLGVGEEDGLALGMEFVLEGLHQHSMVSKREDGVTTAYRDMLKAMFDHMAKSGDN